MIKKRKEGLYICIICIEYISWCHEYIKSHTWWPSLDILHVVFAYFFNLLLYPVVSTTLSCSRASHQKLFYCTSVSGQNAIFVYHMPKKMGAIFHSARIERLMAVDGEGKLFNKSGFGKMRRIKMKEEREKVNTSSASLISLLQCSTKQITGWVFKTRDGECNIQICFPLVM